MFTDIVIPRFGVPTTGTLTLKWVTKAGDYVRRGDVLCKAVSSFVEVEIPAPASGVLFEISFSDGWSVSAGTVIGLISDEGDEARWQRMMSELAPLDDKLAESGQRVVHRAIRETNLKEDGLLDVGHIFLVLCEDEADGFVGEALGRCGLSPAAVIPVLKQEIHNRLFLWRGRGRISEACWELLYSALSCAYQHNRPAIEAVDLFAPLFADAAGAPARTLQRFGVDPGTVFRYAEQAALSWEAGRATPAAGPASSSPLRAHLLTLPLSHTTPPTPSRPAAWLRGAAAAGVCLPLCLAQDLGTLLTQPRQRLVLARPAHLPDDVSTATYLNFLNRLAGHPLLREVSSWDISDAVTGVVLARLAAGIPAPDVYALPAGAQAAAFARRLSFELERADPAHLWRTADPSRRPDLTHVLPAAAMAQIESNLIRLEPDELRFLHRYGPRFTGAPDPRYLLDLFNLLQLPPALRLALTQVLHLLPRVSEAASVGGMQTYSLGGYGGIARRGNLDNLLLTELAYPPEMLLHRLLNQEALYYGREAERERQRELAYIVTHVGPEMLGDGEVLARALTLALGQTMLRRGYEVLHSFVGSEWTVPEPINRPVDVQRVLYYRDTGWLRAGEMLGAVAAQMRAWGERYRGQQVMWVVGEHWDADEYAEHDALYRDLRSRGGQQAWFVRVGKGGRKSRPVAAGEFESYEIVNTEVMWASQPPPPLVAAAPEPEPETPPPAATEATPLSPASRYGATDINFPSEFTEEEKRYHNDARRFARLLVSEIRLYNEEAVRRGRAAGDIYSRLREDIDRSREMYDRRVRPEVAGRYDYFHDALVKGLAEGDPAKLGEGYPGPSVADALDPAVVEEVIERAWRDAERRIKNVLKEEFNVAESELSMDANFIADLGLDSLDTLELLMRCEEELGIEVSDEDAEKLLTVGDGAKYLKGRLIEEVIHSGWASGVGREGGGTPW